MTSGRSVYFLVAFLVLLNALLGAFTGQKTLFLEKEVLHLSAGAVTTLNLLLNVPLYLQPFLATGMDLFPLLGRRRRSYFVLAALLSAAGYGALAALPEYRLPPFAALLLVAATGGALRVVLTNAILVRFGNLTGDFRKIQSLQQLLPLIYTAAFAGQLGGLVTERWSYRAAFAAAALVALAFAALTPLVPEEEARPPERRQRAGELRAALRDRRVWIVVAFAVYYGILPVPDTARPYYFADALHFSKEFIGQLGAWNAGGSLVGILAYQFFPKKWRLRPLAMLALSAATLGIVPQLLIRDPVSARLLMALSGAVLVVSGLAYTAAMARACAPGVEGPVFGLLAAVGALFYLVCDWIGTHLYDWFGPAAGYSIEHGWYVSVWANILSGLPGYVFLFFLPRHDPADGPAETATTRR